VAHVVTHRGVGTARAERPATGSTKTALIYGADEA